MVTEWGMSDTLGAVNVAGDRRARFLDMAMPVERGPYSEETARQIDHEVRRIVTGAHEDARRLLSEHRDLLERVTRRLLEREVMDGEELRAMMSGAPAVAAVEPRAPSPVV
jgi:cell division protease FtsH